MKLWYSTSICTPYIQKKPWNKKGNDLVMLDKFFKKSWDFGLCICMYTPAPPKMFWNALHYELFPHSCTYCTNITFYYNVLAIKLLYQNQMWYFSVIGALIIYILNIVVIYMYFISKINLRKCTWFHPTTTN